MGRIICSLNENLNYKIPTLPEFSDSKKLYNVLNTLSPHSRQVLILYHLEGYTPKEIAQNLNISQRAVYGRLSRAKQKLQKILETI